MATRTFVEEGLEYTASNGRMRYNPEFHENHGNRFSDDDLIYMCSMWSSMRKKNIAKALGKTHDKVLSKVRYLKKTKKFEYYKKLGKEL